MTEDQPAFALDAALDSELQLGALARVIRFSDRFTLVFAVCNDVQYRGELILRLERDLTDAATAVLRLGEPVLNLLDLLMSGSYAEIRALHIVGLEAWIGSGEDGERLPFVQNLNAARNRFPHAFDGTLVLWVPEYLLGVLHSGAPDFFSVRSGLFTFASPRVEREAQAARFGESDWRRTVDLGQEEMQERIERLERLIAEYGALPADERDQAAVARLEHSLAMTYLAHGMPAKALPHAQEALRIRTELLGEAHPDTLTSLNYLANTHFDLGRYEEARALHAQALEMRRKHLGEDHPDTLASMGNLANASAAMGRFEDALHLEEEALPKKHELLGPAHPSTLMSMRNLGSIYTALRRHRDALRIKEDAFRLSKENLGETHPDTLKSLTSLASTYSDLGRFREALDLKQRTLDIRREKLGPAHPDTLVSLSNLARSYSEVHRYDKARELDEEALRLRAEALGEAHPDTLLSRFNLGVDLYLAHRYEEALGLWREALQIAKKADHDDLPVARSIFHAVRNGVVEHPELRKKGDPK